MTLHTAMHLLGCTSLLVIAIVASLVFGDAWRQRARIWSLILANFEPLLEAVGAVFPGTSDADTDEAAA